VRQEGHNRTGIGGGCEQKRFYLLSAAGLCQDNEVVLQVSLPIDAPRIEIIQRTTEAIQKLSRRFDAFVFPAQIIEAQVTKMMNRQL
jgi:hypothetical protein